MAKKNSQKNTLVVPANRIKRPPVVAVMGHIDHGKSTLLDYIRKTNIVAGEVGGITQRISAYEVMAPERITFIDTPGHEAFSGMRERGAATADIAVLVVSAEDGVKKQTIEAYKQISEAKIPMIVAINKIDKPGADLERAKMSLAENEIYLEGYGGSVSYVPVSAKTGAGVEELLDLIILTADVAELAGDTSKPAEGTIIEAHRDPKKGISATLIIKDGSLSTGMFTASGESYSPTRMIEDSLGKKIVSATFSSPVRIVGWNTAPQIGGLFVTLANKAELENYLESVKEKKRNTAISPRTTVEVTNKKNLPVIIKADVLGSVEAIEHEIKKIKSERVAIKILFAGIGDITESDVKVAGSDKQAVVLGFNIGTDSQAAAMIERLGLEHADFDIIYKLVEWLSAKVTERTPKIAEEEVRGKAKIMRFFSRTRDKQIVGGKVSVGEIHIGDRVKIIRRETIIGDGVIRELQQAKVKTGSVNEGFEFGTMIEAKIEIAPGDVIEDFVIVEK
ncbi:MAG: translation initiation factor IF-2 [bacterium]|nr:translation initiation factor IF-2 [bacterium]